MERANRLIQSENEDDEDNFENGSNVQEIEMRSDVDQVDGQKFEHMISDYANFNEHFAHMSIKQKTSYFVRLSLVLSL